MSQIIKRCLSFPFILPVGPPHGQGDLFAQWTFKGVEQDKVGVWTCYSNFFNILMELPELRSSSLESGKDVILQWHMIGKDVHLQSQDLKIYTHVSGLNTRRTQTIIKLQFTMKPYTTRIFHFDVNGCVHHICF